MRNETINDWVPETKSLLERLVAAGCEIVKGNNGEEWFSFPAKTTPDNYPAAVAEFIDNLTATDESHLYVKVPGYDRTFWLFLVYGNCPGELVCDYSLPDGPALSEDSFVLNAVTTAHYDEWSNRKQPEKHGRYEDGKWVNA